MLALWAPNMQKRAMSQVAWPEIMLITGVSTYVAVLEHMGTITFVGDSVAGLGSPLIAALLLCFIGAVVSAFASSTAVLGSLIPLAVPFLQAGTGVSAIGFIAAMAVASTIVDVSPFSTNGALVLANAQGVDRQVFFRRLLGYGAMRDRGRPDRPLAHLHRGAGMSLDLAPKETPVNKPVPTDRQSRPAFLGDLLDTLTERGRNLLRRREPEAPVAAPDLATLGDLLLSRRGEASGVALARALVAAFDAAAPEERRGFLALLAERFGPDRAAVEAAIAAIGRDEPDAIETLHAASEPRRQELLAAPEPRAGRHSGAGKDAGGALEAPARAAGPSPARLRLRASLWLVVQPRLPGAAPHRLDDAGEHPREDHPLRGGPRHPELGRPPQPARSRPTAAATASSTRSWSTSR